ncbi:CoA-binding protein [Kosmotoga pacifica]|uniref:CoA-binding protein n=1 Tax=Kosmotoga pacifica TaxID=1330330 RepID=A0A0G2Z9A7_9BACT|nr:CoA-binding protein [Kosmotoga pacifica]AKI98142.1 CoA-binding protein [Kosmotoga pacifica]
MKTSPEIAREVLLKFRRIIVVGFSKNAEKAANFVPMFLKEMGYEIIPVNPTMSEYGGMKVYADLGEVVASGISLELVEIFRPSEEAEAVALKAMELGAKALWLQKGISSLRAEQKAKEKGIDYVQDRCMYEDYKNFFNTKRLTEL